MKMTCTSSDLEKNLKSFKKVELKSEISCANPEGGGGAAGGLTHPLKITSYLGSYRQ